MQWGETRACSVISTIPQVVIWKDDTPNKRLIQTLGRNQVWCAGGTGFTAELSVVWCLSTQEVSDPDL